MILRYNYYFDAAHRLEKHQGKCWNLHGHKWKVNIEVDSEMRLENGMLIDFGDLKEIIDSFDHSIILNDCEENKELIKLFRKYGFKMVLLDNSPTAEKLSLEITEKVREKVGREATIKITVFENENASIEYTN